MSEKIKYTDAISWLIALCIAIGVVFTTGYFSSWHLFSPIQPAIAISSVQAINVFSEGTIGTDPFWPERLYMLGSIILIFVVGPVLWMAGSLQRSRGRKACWYTGATLMLIGVIQAGIGLYQSGLYHYGSVNNSNREIAERSRNIDQVRSELATLSNRAMVLYWIPKNEGGADKRYKSLTLEDLKKDEQFKNAFVMVESQQDSTLLIYGIGKIKGKDPDFQNINDQIGKIQVAVKINPATLKTEWLKADSLRN